ncbi:hypothetical protein [Bosea robiniae]|jgi:hypothetical protein|uniref:BioF2-like acetyltransferase domain-containing protein n=1 Tax=Bosea robiniae TaxID=1036780 RepID=A0ABY0NFR2_9HYPH|nr:hypothetical protein [Bosea robiniae]SDF38866.1 hypothetical protein SAMN05421844_101496 [Bosea robiniae]
MALARFLTSRLHKLLEPWQSAARKSRLRNFDLPPGAALPIAHIRAEAPHRCDHPLCGLLVDDAIRFHSRNAPRAGFRRRGVPTAMLLDMTRYPTAETYLRAVSKRSHGNIPRAAKKAARLGITCAPIRPESYRASIAAIGASKRFRSGGPVLSAWFRPASVIADTREPPSSPPCPSHWTMAWGAFVQEESGPRLVAHLSLRRVGDLCRTHDIMCHGDYLQSGAMKLLFLETTRWLLDRQAPETQGLRWFMYGAMEHGSPGLHEWKRLMCFEPANLAFERDLHSGGVAPS